MSCSNTNSSVAKCHVIIQIAVWLNVLKVKTSIKTSIFEFVAKSCIFYNHSMLK